MIHTFAPIGLIVQDIMGRGLNYSQRYFTLTQAGETYGQPAAAFSLKYAVDHNTSLFNLLGSTQSGGDSRAPYNRARLVELVRGGISTIWELGSITGLNSGVIRHFEFFFIIIRINFFHITAG